MNYLREFSLLIHQEIFGEFSRKFYILLLGMFCFDILLMTMHISYICEIGFDDDRVLRDRCYSIVVAHNLRRFVENYICLSVI